MIQVSPQITAITIARPTIVRTRLAPPELVCVAPEAALRFSGAFSPLVLEGAVNASAGQAEASRQAPSTAVAVATARKSRIGLVIEGRLRGRVARVIGPAAKVLSGSGRGP